jgi:lipopolysaccharide biosynthesis protein
MKQPKKIENVGADFSDIRLIAFYLTQFHPTPENDLWWGRGFTEWTNATKATAKFPGHNQPHLPTDLGFYDLRVRQTRHDQIEMAKSYGVGGFCYYYYWFSGKRILHEPLDDMLADKKSDMPFCLCWANENWTRRWDAAEQEILIAQKYRKNDDLEFIKSIVPFMKDKRYIRLNGKLILLVYRPQHLPDAKKSASIWRAHCKSAGLGEIEIYCCFTHSNWDYKKFGFDGGIEFPPHNMDKPNYRDYLNHVKGYTGYIFDYHDVAEMYLNRDYKNYNGFRSVFPSWDNTARTGLRAAIGLNGTPENYEYWLSQALSKTKADYPGQERLVFINAWNEWAEGCHLEPCRTYGHKFLEATKRVKNGEINFKSWTHVGVPMEAQLTSAQAAKTKTLLGQLRKKVRDILGL